MAGAFPSGERSARMTRVPDGSARCRAARTHRDVGTSPAGPRERLSRDVSSWAATRRYIYFEGQAGDTQNVWRVTVDPLDRKMDRWPRRLTTGAGEETNMALSPDGTRLIFTATSSRTRLWAFPFDPGNGRVTGEPYPITMAAREKSISTRAPTARRSPTAPSGLAATSCGNVRFSKDRNGCCCRARTGVRQAALVAGRREAGVLALRGARTTLSRVAVLNTDGSGERVLT